MSRKITLLLVGLLFGFAQAGAQGCGNGRYTQEIFNDFTLTSDITYGQNINLQNQNQSLELDIYEPMGDMEPLRPLIVLQHGGSFIGGSKDQGDITTLAEPLARMGYVVASAEYRLGMAGIPFPGPDSSSASESVLRAVHDFKAAVRWFYQSAANGNPYRIDTNQLYIGGVSAGAVSAVHYAYLDQLSELPAYTDTTQPGLGGGVEGNSGNPGYSSEVAGVVNICGMVADTAWIQPGDEPIVSLHGDQDQIVPFGTALISVVIYNIFVVDGSSTIHERMNEVGVNNCFYPMYGADHTPHIGSNGAAYQDTTLRIVTNFLQPLICGGGPGSCGYLVSNDQPLPAHDLEVFPNPTQGALRVRIPEAQANSWEYTLTDLMGRTVVTERIDNRNEITLDRRFPAGIYLLRVRVDQGQWTRKVVFE
ncbi:MAG: T9SS type A sorting domain-containing protein [Bacteroidota bacterium]